MSSYLDVRHLLAPVTSWGRQRLSSCCAHEAGCCANRELRRKTCTQEAFGSICRQVLLPSLAVWGLLLGMLLKSYSTQEGPHPKIKCEAGESGRRLIFEQGWRVGGTRGRDAQER